MGLKPFNYMRSINPFTKVNGNLLFNSNMITYLLPSAG